jgi:ribosomal protein L32
MTDRPDVAQFATAFAESCGRLARDARIAARDFDRLFTTIAAAITCRSCGGRRRSGRPCRACVPRR